MQEPITHSRSARTSMREPEVVDPKLPPVENFRRIIPRRCCAMCVHLDVDERLVRRCKRPDGPMFAAASNDDLIHHCDGFKRRQYKRVDLVGSE